MVRIPLEKLSSVTGSGGGGGGDNPADPQAAYTPIDTDPLKKKIKKNKCPLSFMITH